MNQVFLFISLLTISYVGFSQKEPTDSIYTVLDAISKEPVPYATVYNHLSGTGTVTNLKGQFYWKPLGQRDSVTLSFVGYESQFFNSSHPIPASIFLNPKTEILESAYVYGNMTFLYQLIADCKIQKSKKNQTAKTYLSLESIIDNQSVESMEVYYNGLFNGYDCKELQLKTGRLAISNFGNRFFISTETSKALYLHELYESTGHFPTSPMGLSRKKLAKLFELKFVKYYEEDNAHTIYQINYTPTKDCDDCFHGTLWVDSLQHQIQKVTLQTDSTLRHPFIPIGHSDKLLNVSLEITKNYQTNKDVAQFKSTDFNYQLVYKTISDSIFTVNTNALVYAYDYDSKFDLPHFEYGNIRYKDYILIGSIPYNWFFWNNYKEFNMANQKESVLFSSLNPAQTGTFVNTNNPYFDKPFFEHAYKPWSIKRIELNQALSDEVGRAVSLEAPPSQQYKLKTQIYLDINKINDSLHTVTSSYFDPYYSYFYLPQSAKTDAFVNMYFDLTEIKRRELEKQIQHASSRKEVEKLYQIKLNELAIQQKQFIKETQRGNNLKAMQQWNDYIVKRLKIDNLELFHLSE
ncbi:MAG: carboxypeptidase-like regulatory domain-containing protein [Salibacteraceae bacterium]